MNQSDFEALLSDTTKRILTDISWGEDEDHSPAVEFRVEVESDPGYPIFVRGSYNALIGTLSYTFIHRGSGRVYALDLGKDHHNPDCNHVGEKHKHRWNEPVRDKEAYVPADITAAVTDPVDVWRQFCAEANISHQGTMHNPPPVQLEMI
ncbi:MAG: hypothetical protein AABN33_16985 [Acidobacteriota bacterium]